MNEIRPPKTPNPMHLSQSHASLSLSLSLSVGSCTTVVHMLCKSVNTWSGPHEVGSTTLITPYVSTIMYMLCTTVMQGSMLIYIYIYIYVCVCEREREREQDKGDFGVLCIFDFQSIMHESALS
jgi:hypothetical protein